MWHAKSQLLCVGSSSLTRDQTHALWFGAWTFSHRITRDVPRLCFLILNLDPLICLSLKVNFHFSSSDYKWTVISSVYASACIFPFNIVQMIHSVIQVSLIHVFCNFENIPLSEYTTVYPLSRWTKIWKVYCFVITNNVSMNIFVYVTLYVCVDKRIAIY